MIKNQKIFKEYIDNYSKIIQHDKILLFNLNKTIEILKKFRKKNRVHIFGNGGSATIASHFSMDLSNNSKIKCLNYNDPAIISCYANDFKFENWI